MNEPNIVKLAGIAVAFWATGCASAASVSNMVPADVDLDDPVNGSVVVRVIAGKEIKYGYSVDVKNADVEAALRDSIKKSGAFTSVVEGAAASSSSSSARLNALRDQDAQNAASDYVLIVQVTGFDVENREGWNDTLVTLQSAWKLRRGSGGDVLATKDIKVTQLVPIEGNFNGPKRINLAVEGALKKTIRGGLEEMSKFRRK